MLTEKMLRDTGIKRVLSQAFFTGFERESVPRNRHSQKTGLRTDAAIALRYVDDGWC